MARIDEYRKYVQDLILQHSQYKPAYGDVEVQTIFDKERDHYQLMLTGWHDERCTYGCLMHIDIKDGKIWIQWDGTEVGTANELVEIGVPKEDIVLAFYPPYKRPYTGFGVN
jgi:hypothetical protein